MSIFFIYMIKTALCLAAFYILYKLLFGRDTQHAFNRGVALGLMALSVLLPSVHVPVTSMPVAVGGMTTVEGLIEAQAVEGTGAAGGMTLEQTVLLIYIIGVIFFAVREVRAFISLHSLIRRGRTEELEDGVRLVVVKGDVSPFSWFGNVIISEKDLKECPDKIITHERAHIKGRHSIDILLCDALTTIQWFNPAAWLFKAELQDIHEYEADAAVLKSGGDASEYQLLLIRKAVGDRLYSIANNFNHSSLKKRIEMMKTKKTNPWSRIKLMAVLPVAAIAIAAFADPTVKSIETQVNNEGGNVAEAASAEMRKAAPEVSNTTYDSSKGATEITEEMPQFPGGTEMLMKFLQVKLKYPAEAVKAKREGKVITSFIVSKDGSIKDAKIIRGISPELDAEALRVINIMPKWTPGKRNGEPVNVRYTLPITFKLPMKSDLIPATRRKTYNP